MAGKIFINYRRDDDPGNTGRLFDHLEQAFAREQLFYDVDSIAPGLDFVRVLEEQVARCDVLLAMIGPRWLTAVDEHGRRRLDKPNDFVRIEIESALKQDKRVIPVLLGQTLIPSEDELPEAIRPLARHNALRLTNDRFRADANSVVSKLRQVLNEIEAGRRIQAEGTRRAQADTERQREADAANERAKAEPEAPRADLQRQAWAAHDDEERERAAWASASTAGEAAALKAFLTKLAGEPIRKGSAEADQDYRGRSAVAAAAANAASGPRYAARFGVFSCDGCSDSSLHNPRRRNRPAFSADRRQPCRHSRLSTPHHAWRHRTRALLARLYLGNGGTRV